MTGLLPAPLQADHEKYGISREFIDGVRNGTLALIEGAHRTGKSTLCRYLAYYLLHNETGRAAYYSSDYNAIALVERMANQHFNVTAEVLSDRFRIYRTGAARSTRTASEALEALKRHLSGMIPEYRLIILDSPGRFLAAVTPREQMSFITSCRDLYQPSRSIVMVLDHHAVDEDTLAQARQTTGCYLVTMMRKETA